MKNGCKREATKQNYSFWVGKRKKNDLKVIYLGSRCSGRRDNQIGRQSCSEANIEQTADQITDTAPQIHASYAAVQANNFHFHFTGRLIESRV